MSNNDIKNNDINDKAISEITPTNTSVNDSDVSNPNIGEEPTNGCQSRDIIRTKQFVYNTNWDYVAECDLQQCENAMRRALDDRQLEDYQKRDILFKYGRRRQEILHYPTDYTTELRERTIQMNDHLSRKCIRAGKIMLDLLKMAKERGLDSEKLMLSMDVVVSANQPWDADELERTMVSEVMDYNLVCKSYYNNDNPEEYTQRNKILGLSSDDDNWNECLPEDWSRGMQLTFPFDRIRDGVPLSWQRITEIRNYDIVIDETYEL